MKLINADYLTGRIFTEADLTNAHTCYESIMAIIESMELEDMLDKIADIVNGTIDHCDRDEALDMLYDIKDIVEGRR